MLHIEWFITHITGKWTFIPLCSVNDLLQNHHEYGCSPRCLHWCTFRKPCYLNDLIHTTHMYGHFLLCMQGCLFRSPCFLKNLLHTSHLYRRSPLWMHWCTFRLPCSVNDLLQTSHIHVCSTLFLHCLQMMQHPRWHHMYVDILRCVCIEVHSDHSSPWMIYYKHHKYKDVLH